MSLILFSLWNPSLIFSKFFFLSTADLHWLHQNQFYGLGLALITDPIKESINVVNLENNDMNERMKLASSDSVYLFSLTSLKVLYIYYSPPVGNRSSFFYAELAIVWNSADQLNICSKFVQLQISRSTVACKIGKKISPKARSLFSQI